MSAAATTRRFEGRSVVVIGGGRGVGHAAALAYAREGAQVAVADASAELAEETLAAIVALGGRGLAARVRPPVAVDVERFVAQTVASFGGVNALLCAHTEHDAADVPITEIEPAVFRALLDSNLRSAYLAARFALPALVKSGGSIVFTAAEDALPGRTSTAACTGGGAVVTFMKCVVYQYGPRGVRANAIVPGLVNLQGQAGTEEDAARLALFLSSDEASYITGAVLAVEEYRRPATR